MAEMVENEPLTKTNLSIMTDGRLLSLQYAESGEINLSFTTSAKESSEASAQSSHESHTISTTAEDCNWNVYATKKPLLSFHTQSRANIAESDSNRQVARVGNRVYFLDKLKEDGTFESFVPTKFSLSFDEITKQGRYLIVTSRQKVTDVPTVERDPPKTEDKATDVDDEISSSVETRTDSDNKGPEKPKVETDTKNTEAKASSDAKEPDIKKTDSDTKATEDKKAASDSESEPEDDPYEVSNSEDELSAYESWSEGSTDLDEIGVRAVRDLRPEMPPLEKDRKTKTATNKGAGSDKDTSSDESDSDSDKSCSCCHSDSDDSVVSDGNERFESQAANDEEEVYRMYDAVYDDAEDPHGDDESNEDDDMWAQQYKESGWALFGDEDDFDDSFRQFDDGDSDDCSDCGGDDGACVLLGDDKKPKADKEEEEETNEPPLGSPVAQIHVYDTSRPQEDDDNKPSFKRLFRYQASIMNSLSNSPPAVHPSKSLLVWPLGDSKIMLADYKRNTYFVKRLRLSRLFSQHISVNCRFSSNGDHLHVLALERQGKPPLRRKEMLKLKKDKNKAKKEKEVPVYDLVLSTYRMSKGKTARSPPVLIHQIKLALGPLEEKYALPTYTWRDTSILVARATADRQAEVREIQLFREAKSDVKVFVVETQADLGGMQIHLSDEWNRSSTELTSKDLLLSEVQQIRPFYKPEEGKKDGESNTTESKAETTDHKAAVEKAVMPEVPSNGAVEEIAQT